MSESNVFCMDCMEGLRAFPDKFFDLAVVDPPYGINITGRHKNGSLVGGGKRPVPAIGPLKGGT